MSKQVKAFRAPEAGGGTSEGTLVRRVHARAKTRFSMKSP